MLRLRAAELECGMVLLHDGGRAHPIAEITWRADIGRYRLRLTDPGPPLIILLRPDDLVTVRLR